MHQNEWLKFDFSKIFWGGAYWAPSPDRPPVFSRATPSVRASPSILERFVPSTWASSSILGRFRPRFGLRPQLSIGELGLPLQINFLIRQSWSAPPSANSWIWYLAIPIDQYSTVVPNLWSGGPKVARHASKSGPRRVDLLKNLKNICAKLLNFPFWQGRQVGHEPLCPLCNYNYII